ncbi:MAG: PucR family transcriptional regulator ligand-binding domain-containing protein [bacterium]|nr:PucR family transcriptional regulator ligand-binding domain-containing protein [bacterium]
MEILQGAVLLAGEGGLDRQIRRVTIAEVPDIVNWVRGEELILTSGFALRQDSEAQQSFVERMAMAGVSAIAIKPERFLGKIPDGMITQADADDIPLIQVPADIPWTDISTSVHDLLLDKQVRILKRSEEVQRELTRKVLDAGGSGIEAVAATLASLVDHPVLIEDRNLDLIVSVAEDGSPLRLKAPGSAEEGRRHLSDKLIDLACPKRIYEPAYEGYDSRVIAPICIRNRCCGYISVMEGEKLLPDFDHIALEHAATAAALEMARDAAVATAERRLHRDLWDELLSGNIQTVESIASRAESLGCDIERGYVSIVLLPDNSEADEASPAEIPLNRLTQEIMDRWPGAVNPVVLDRSDSIVILYPVMEDFKIDTLRADLERLRRRLERDLPSLEFSIGVGGYYSDILDLYRSHLEARKAIQMGRRLHGLGKDAFYDDMGGYRLLYNYQDRNRVLNFMRETIGVLIDYDESHRTELVETLKAYFDSGESIKVAAEQLFVHRHTLEYRLGQILTLTGANLKTPEDQLNLRMALAIHDLLAK